MFSVIVNIHATLVTLCRLLVEINHDIAPSGRGFRNIAESRDSPRQSSLRTDKLNTDRK